MRQRYVHRHLVAVEVGVVGMTYQRMQLDGLSIHEDGVESLNAKTVQRRCTVEQDRVFLDNFIKDGPYGIGLFLNQALRLLDIVDNAILYQLLHDERLVQLKGHLRRKTALVHSQLGTDNDYRTSGVVNTLSEQVLSEPALLALQHVGEALQRPVARALDNPLAL